MGSFFIIMISDDQVLLYVSNAYLHMLYNEYESKMLSLIKVTPLPYFYNGTYGKYSS